MVPIFFTSCASHKAEKLSLLTFDVAAPLENVYMSCKALIKLIQNVISEKMFYRVATSPSKSLFETTPKTLILFPLMELAFLIKTLIK